MGLRCDLINKHVLQYLHFTLLYTYLLLNKLRTIDLAKRVCILLLNTYMYLALVFRFTRSTMTSFVYNKITAVTQVPGI